MVRTWKAGLVLGIAVIAYGLMPVHSYSGSSSETNFDSVQFSGEDLKLSQVDGSCAFTSGNQAKAIKLDVGIPCYFQRQDGELLVANFPRFSVEKIIAVIGTPIEPALRSRLGIDADVVCAQKAQGIVVDGQTFTIVSHVADGGTWCRDKGVDWKRLYEFAEEYKKSR